MKTNKGPLHLKSSNHPEFILEHLPRRADQPPSMRHYRPGWDGYLDLIPVLSPGDPLLGMKAQMSAGVIRALAFDLVSNAKWLFDTTLWPSAGDFSREILAVEDPEFEPVDEAMAALFNEDSMTMDKYPELAEAFQRAQFKGIVKEGAELLVARWGKGFSSPPHGHGVGLLHEEILFGQMLVDTFLSKDGETARPMLREIAGRGTLVSRYNPPSPLGPRMGLIHAFTALTQAASLHFVPEHTRDGRDNGFEIQHFNDEGGLQPRDLIHLTNEEAIDGLRLGDVALVRSANVPDYGDHYIVITGPKRMKDHGLRPEDKAIMAHGLDKTLLNMYRPDRGVTILKLDSFAREAFLAFHGIKHDEKLGTIQWPSA